jgi:hypothetical protein
MSAEIFSAENTKGFPGVFRADVEIFRAEALFALGRRHEAKLAFDQGWHRLRDLEPASEFHQHALRVQRLLDQSR